MTPPGSGAAAPLTGSLDPDAAPRPLRAAPNAPASVAAIAPAPVAPAALGPPPPGLLSVALPEPRAGGEAVPARPGQASEKPSLDLAARAALHDIGNLLTATIGAAEAALARPGLDPETIADLACILEAASRGCDLVRTARSVAAAPSTRPPPVLLDDAIRRAARLMTHIVGRMGLTLTLAAPGGLIRIDPGRLDRVLLNLLLNARHAMTAGGTATVRTARRTLAAPERCVPDTIPPGNWLTLAVADTGAGIPAGALPRLFEPGFTTRAADGGSGLGLASVRDIVRAAGGFLAVESVSGHGTTVEIYFPADPLALAATPGGTVGRGEGGSAAVSGRAVAVRGEAAPVAAAIAPGAAPPTLVRRRAALVVDDELLVRRVAERLLFRAGWTVHTAESAEAAQTLLERTPCALLVTDLAMPGLNGMELARWARARWPDLPVLLTSGYAPSPGGVDLPGADVAFLTKPYDRAALLRVVARIAPDRASPAAPGPVLPP